LKTECSIQAETFVVREIDDNELMLRKSLRLMELFVGNGFSESTKQMSNMFF